MSKTSEVPACLKDVSHNSINDEDMVHNSFLKTDEVSGVNEEDNDTNMTLNVEEENTESDEKIKPAHHCIEENKVISLSSPLKRKLSIEYDPSVEEHIGGSIDDESSILRDEDEKNEDELSQLEKESDLPISDLMALYGFVHKEDGSISDEEVQFRIEDSQDSDINCDELDTDSVNDIDMEQPAIYDKELDWKKEIMIGPDYQADVPVYEDNEMYTDEPNNDMLLWSPYLTNLDEVDKYLDQIYKEDSGDDLPIVDTNRDDEQALYHLHKHCYKTQDALSNKNRHSLYKTMESWTEEECQGFENGLKIYGKQFNLIHNNMIPSRDIREIIQFYYLWKKTERYDIFIQYSRLGTKRYIFNPGQPLDLDRAPYLCSQDEDLVRDEQENASLMCT